MQDLLQALADDLSDAFTAKARVSGNSIKFNMDTVTFGQLEVVESLATNTLAPDYSHEMVIKRSGTGVCIIVAVDSTEE